MAGLNMLASWMKEQKPQGPSMKSAPVFYRNLEEALDVKRAEQGFYARNISPWKTGQAVDFGSNDILSLGTSGRIREAFLKELAQHPDFSLYSGGSRAVDGNYKYIEQVEQEIADFHGAKTAIILGSGFEANVAIYEAIPRPGDVIIYDELVHASTNDGMRNSLAQHKLSFRHNDVDAFRETLISVLDSQPMIRNGSRCVLISVESVYSMDGDLCPLEEFIDITKELCPHENAVFIVDEAHATGVVGPKGEGLVSALGLENEIAVRLHTCGKAMASSGAYILGNETIRRTILNFSRSVVYTTAPSFTEVAAIRAGLHLLSSGQCQDLQQNIQHLVEHFFDAMTSNSVWEEASSLGILSIPLLDVRDTQQFITHIVALWTRQRYNYWLVFQLQLAGFCAFPMDYPTVPKGQSRIRLMIHGGNTEAEVEALATCICDFAREMIDIEKKGADATGRTGIPKAAQQIYALMSSV
ncbi:putative aminotransferase [Astrocystis sublimbata]|nr:putative aminotransferase [Astrocystis sublimbata]